MINFIKKRLLSFTAVLGIIAFLLIVSLVLSGALSALSAQLSGLVPGATIIWRVLNFFVSFVIITFLFALIYNFMPDAKIA